MNGDLTIRPERRTRRLEKYVGYIVALYVVTIVFVLLSQFVIVIKPKEKPRPFTIMVEPAPELPAPEPPEETIELESPEPPPINEVAATRENSTEEGEMLVNPVEGERTQADELLFEEQTQPAPATIQSWIPNIQEQAEINALREHESLVSQSLEQRQNAIAEKLVRMEVVSSARDFTIDTDGGIAGAIRLFDIEGFPDHVVRMVMERYDIIYERRYVKPSPGRNYLNAASTNDGTYTNRQEEGFYNVLVFPSKTLSQLAVKETSALMDQGFDPRGTRVRKIVFGIVKNDRNEYDLDVVDLEVEKIR